MGRWSIRKQFIIGNERTYNKHCCMYYALVVLKINYFESELN